MTQEGGKRAERHRPVLLAVKKVRLSGEAATELQGGAVGREDAAVRARRPGFVLGVEELPLVAHGIWEAAGTAIVRCSSGRNK
jgi:hypothetical protein